MVSSCSAFHAIITYIRADAVFLHCQHKLTVFTKATPLARPYSLLPLPPYPHGLEGGWV